MKKYYKRDAESDLGFGTVYLEFDGEWATRQVEKYGERWFCSNVEYHEDIGPALVDQPLSVLELSIENEISLFEFEEAWEQAIRYGN